MENRLQWGTQSGDPPGSYRDNAGERRWQMELGAAAQVTTRAWRLAKF